jgi:AcrR family transcriptional regulator
MITADITSTPIEATPSRAYAGALGRLYESAAESFAHPTGAVVERGHVSHGSPGTRAATIADPEVIADLADAPELRAIEELRAWLRLSYDDVARAAGLSGASLLHHWRQRYRTGSPVRPRAATVEQLWRRHALVRAVAEALEGADQSYAVGLWVRRPEDGVTPLELLLAGRVDEFERRAGRLLFDPGRRPAPSSRVAGVEPDDELGPVDTPPAPTYQDSDFG